MACWMVNNIWGIHSICFEDGWFSLKSGMTGRCWCEGMAGTSLSPSLWWSDTLASSGCSSSLSSRGGGGKFFKSSLLYPLKFWIRMPYTFHPYFSSCYWVVFQKASSWVDLVVVVDKQVSHFRPQIDTNKELIDGARCGMVLSKLYMSN